MKTISTKRQVRKAKNGRGPTRFPEIAEDAAALGRCRYHLYRVLTGQRRSHSLLAAYQELQARKEAAR